MGAPHPNTNQEPPEQLFRPVGQVVGDIQQEGRGEEDGQNRNTDDRRAGEEGNEGGGQESAVEVIESLCMNCGKNGQTRLLLTSIPFFKEVVILSFRCEHCGTRNNEVQPAAEIQELGSIYTLRLLSSTDLNRSVVRSSHCQLSIPSLQLTIPPLSTNSDPLRRGGKLTTVEGILRDVRRDLSSGQEERRELAREMVLRAQIINENEEKEKGLKEAEEMVKVWERIKGICDTLSEVLGSEVDDDQEGAIDPLINATAVVPGGTQSTQEGQPHDRNDSTTTTTAATTATATTATASSEERSFPPLTLTLTDPTGNSFAQALTPNPFDDNKWSKRNFKRTKEDNIAIGLIDGDEKDKEEGGKGEEAEETLSVEEALERARKRMAEIDLEEDGEGEANGADGKKGLGVAAGDAGDMEEGEVMRFGAACPSCAKHIETLMKTVNIPHFKDAIIMATNCDNCGYRDSEVKSGGAIALKGRKIELLVEDGEDLKRDVLKSDTASFTIPSIQLHLEPGTLGGRFTTLEGLLNQVYEELDTRAFAWQSGDSATHTLATETSTVLTVEEEKERLGDKGKVEEFLGKLKAVMTASPSILPFTIQIDDPLSNSYIQNPYAPDKDPNMKEEEYERSKEENDELGLNDMKVEGYEKDHVPSTNHVEAEANS